MKDTQRYACSISAIMRQGGQLMVTNTVIIVKASSEDEAFGRAIKYAEEHFLASDGYRDYKAVVLLIEEETK